jgi:hypothetical protein
MANKTAPAKNGRVGLTFVKPEFKPAEAKFLISEGTRLNLIGHTRCVVLSGHQLWSH